MNEQTLQHNIIIENRKTLLLTGVKEVQNFCEEEINLVTSLGTLTVRGSNLKIGNFNTETGDLSATGEIVAVVYLNKTAKGGFFGRLFS